MFSIVLLSKGNTNISYPMVINYLQHGVLEVFAQKKGVASRDTHARGEFLLDDRFGHFHEKLGHLGQRQIDLLA